MDKQKLLENIEHANDLIQKAAEEDELNTALLAMEWLATVLEEIIPVLAETKAKAEMCEIVLGRML